MERRFIIQIDFYEWGETERDAYNRAMLIVNNINDMLDNSCKLTGMWEHSYGQIGTTARVVNLDSLKTKDKT